MKNFLLLVTCAISIMCSAQISPDKRINYITGSPQVAGYSIKTCYIDTTNLNISNSTPAPILQFYMASKSSFIGGTLIDEKGNKTQISDLKFEKTSDFKNNSFTIVGKNFSRGFTLNNGFILKEENKEIVFYTDKIGIWKVIKK